MRWQVAEIIREVQQIYTDYCLNHRQEARDRGTDYLYMVFILEGFT